MTRLLLALVRCYQVALSPFLGRSCRFHPSCSHYAAEAIRTHGAARGSFLAIRRIGRCNPWHPGGFDPVPPAKGRNDAIPGTASEGMAACDGRHEPDRRDGRTNHHS